VGEFTDKSDFSQYIGTSDSLTVKENNDGKYLEFVNDWGTGRTTTQLISNSVYSGNYSISFDFSFEASSDTTQEMYINPAHGGSNYLIHLQENGLIIKAATSSDPIVQIPKAHLPGEWFTARVTKADGYLFVKTWRKGEAEPSDWDLSYYNDDNKKNGVIRLAWYGDHKVVLDMDNLAISRRQDINRLDITKDNVSVCVEEPMDSAVLVLASYKEDKLVDTKIVDVTGDMNVSLSGAELSYDIGNEIRAFLWKDLQNMEPVCDPDSYVVKKETTYGENLISNYNFTGSDGNGTLDGWSLYCDDEYVLQNGMSMELSKPMLNGISKPVLKWNYLIGNQGHIRYIDYKIGKLEPGDYLVSVTVSVPENPGYTAYGLTGSIETDNGYELGRFTNAYKTFAKTVTVTEDQKDVEQSFRISSNGYGDTGSLYVWEASVRKIND